MTSPSSRLGFLGGSDAAVVLGISPWKSRYQLWCEKTGAEIPPSLDSVDYIYFGQILEPIVATEFERRLGKKIRAQRVLSHHPQWPFIAGHVDRLVLNEPAILECKTSNAFDYSKWGDTGGDHSCIPEYYVPQVDHYMLVKDRRRAYVAVLIGGNDFRYYIVERSAQREQQLVAALVDFWALVQNDDPPKIESEQDARKRWKDVVAGTSVPVDLAMRAKILRLAQVKSLLSPLEKEEKKLRDDIIPVFQDKELLSDKTNGEALARLTIYDRTDFDEKAFKEKHPKMAARFIVKKPTKRFKVLI